ncbi:unnamed protein product [Adineta ricciae]|uniref:Reverse transcriptase domain-containing protein n=1 Tax=Adineta ricciae TaxID=249248 RepID=A0A815B514_ADIRI|nr:unnamed protein product [Adineta ricciae]
MTSNLKSINFNRGEVCEQTSSDHASAVGDYGTASINLNKSADSQIVNVSTINGGLFPNNDPNLDNPSLAIDTSLVNSSSSSSVRRPLSMDVTDEEFQTVTYKKSSKVGRQQVSSPDLVFPHHIQNVLNVNETNDNSVLSKQLNITNESTRYALTRYPFAPFVLHFKTGTVTIHQVKEELVNHGKNVHQTDLQLLNCRSTNAGLRMNEYNILVYVKDVSSFSFLLDHQNWPNSFGNEPYILQSLPSIPPQLCLLIKNVDLNLDFEDFSDTIKVKYPKVLNVIRMKNKFQNNIKMIKLELTCQSIRDKLLNERRILVNHISYEIVEYLSPANVLICSKCMALGHFKKQCTQIKETCRTCGELYDDIKHHKCSKIEKCIHCNQNHKSSSLKCQVVKTYRAELTRKLLNLNNPPAPVNTLSSAIQNYVYKPSNFPPPLLSQPPQITPMMNKLDDLINSLSEMKKQLVNVEVKQNKVEQFILDKEKNDEIIKQKITKLSNDHEDLKKDVIHRNLFIDRHENLFVKLTIPMFEDLFTLIASQNHDKKGNVLDADLKSKLERYLIQMKNDKQGLRWQEVLLLDSSLNFDVLILLETGLLDLSFYEKNFYNYRLFFQKGENSNGGVLLLVKNFLQVSRVECSIPNVCVVDVKGIDYVRIVGIYAPESKSWKWDDLSPVISNKCVVFGDFNVDLYKDTQKSELLLAWTDEHFLAPFLPNSRTSLRSDRIIDFAFVKDIDISIQTYQGNTTSDHVPVLSVLSVKTIKNQLANADMMCNIAANYYEDSFKKSEIIKPHPYTDSPVVEYDNVDEVIPEVTLEELIYTVQMKRKKKSVDANGISNFMFNFLDLNHWKLFLNLFNHSFKTALLPSAWKDTRMILLAKKESICSPSLTRPISLIDSFLKIGERLFLTRFRDILVNRGLLPDNQSGFRDGFRLQTRLLLFLEDIYSLMSNSSPVCTIFIDFRSAFDQLWHHGCIGKLRRLGIPISFLNWIEAWLLNRRGFIEIGGRKSRWFSIQKGGPQGSVLTPTLFITYHCDMSQFLSSCSSHFFADDVAAVLAGQIGIRYTDQCIDLEKRIKSFVDYLEYYASIADQPLNRSKTEALFSARAIGKPKFFISFGDAGNDMICWKEEYKYLGYIVSSKLGWGKLIKNVESKS